MRLLRHVPVLIAVGLTVLATSVGPAAASGSGPIALPPANGRFDYQIGGAYRPLPSVKIVDRDRTSTPVKGKYNVCYVNAFQTQPDELRFWMSKHPQLLLKYRGDYLHDPGWPGEVLLDTSTAAKRAQIAKIESGWFAGCAKKGFRAIEPDNLDSWTRSHKELTKADNLGLATLLVKAAHARHLAIAQKNTAGLGTVGAKKIGFDFAIAEECQVYTECSNYTKAYGHEVFEIEYTDNGLKAYPRACRLRGKQISIILRDRDVVPRGHKGYHYQAC